nr:hypothetical protein [Tanacetum cinerariifolium]
GLEKSPSGPSRLPKLENALPRPPGSDEVRLPSRPPPEDEGCCPAAPWPPWSSPPL